MEEIVQYLIDNKITIATMESCTGGMLASLITDIPGASDILKFSAVTYSTEYKIKMGVRKEVIDKYTVYSKETAKEMAYHISLFTNSDIGVGITGKLTSNIDEPLGVDICIYNKASDKYSLAFCEIKKKTRHENKLEVIESFKQLFNSTIKD